MAAATTNSPPTRRFSPEQYRRAISITAVLLVGIMLTGAAVRLTASGLGCEDWPGCSEDRLIPELSFHPWIEFGNRLISGAVAIAVAVAAMGALRRDPRRTDLIVLASGLVTGVIAQILLGLVTVKFHLHPITVSLHFLLSILLLWNVIVLIDRAGGRPGRADPVVDRSTIQLGRAAVACSMVVLIAGTVVTGTGPHSGDSRADRLSFDLDSVVRLHSIAAWVLVALTVGLALRLQMTSDPRADEARRRSRRAVAVVALQGGLGYLQYFTGVPALLVFLHVAGSIAVFIAALTLHLSLFDRGDEFALPSRGTEDGIDRAEARR